MTVLQLVKSVLEEKKSSSEAIEFVLEKFPEVTDEEILSAIETAKRAIALSEKQAADSKAKESEKAAIKESENINVKVLEVVQSEIAKALDKIPLANKEVMSTTEYESFMREEISVKRDGTWIAEFNKFLSAYANGDKAVANDLSLKFREKSIFNSKEEKLLRGDAVTGSLSVPDEFSDMIFSVAQRSSYVFNNSAKINMSSDKMYLLGSGDVSFTEVADQTTELSTSEPTLSQGALDLIDAGAVSYIHDNLIADSNVNIVRLLANAYGRGLAKYVKRATTVGNVATTGDKINGIYSISGIGSQGVADTAGGSIAYEDLVDLIGLIDEVYTDGAHFEMNRREMLKIMKIVDLQGRPIFVDARTQGEPASLLGYPVYLNNQMPITLNATTGARTGGDTATILFGNVGEVQIGLKGGFEFESSPHVKFTFRQTTFRGFVRWAMTVMNTSAYARLTGIK